MSLHSRFRGRARVRTSLALALAGLGVAGGGVAEAHYERITVTANHHILDGSRTMVKGRMYPKDKDRVVWIEGRWAGSSGWRLVARPKTGSRGRFHAFWRPPGVGYYSVRAYLTGSDAAPRRVKGGVTVYRESEASWYGPGFYGHRTACGQTLEANTLGVAHKTLPCGTRVRFYYHGHSVIAPVIDRGPYAGNREYDLTAETKNRLHFGSTGIVWSAPPRGG